MAQVWTWLNPHINLNPTGMTVGIYNSINLVALGIPATAKAVLVQINNTNNSSTLQFAMRPGGLAWERYDGIRANSVSFHYMKLNEGGISIKFTEAQTGAWNVIAYAAEDSPTIWLDAPATLLTQSVAGAYTNIDMSTVTDGRTATAAFVRARGSDTQVIDWRHPASVAQHQSFMGGISLRIFTYFMVGCQGNQFQFYRRFDEGTGDELEVVGYTTAGVVWNASSQPNLNPATTAAWQTFAAGGDVGIMVRAGRDTGANANTIGLRGDSTTPLAGYRNPTFPILRNAAQYPIWSRSGNIDTYRTTSAAANSFFDVEAVLTQVTAQNVIVPTGPLQFLGG